MSITRRSALTLSILCMAAEAVHAASGLGTLGKAAVGCQAVVAKATRKVLEQQFKAVDGCANSLLSCVETKDATREQCFIGARDTCAKALHAADTAAVKAQTKIGAAKSCKSLRLVDLLSSDGLGLGAIVGPCQSDFGLDVCGGDLDTLATCLVRSHTRSAGTVYGYTRPDTGALIAQLPNVDLPDGMPQYPSCANCVVPPAARKALEKCGRTLTRGTRALMATVNGSFDACALAAFACAGAIEPSKCDGKTIATCSRGSAKLAKAVAKFRDGVTKQCGAPTVSFGDLLVAPGIGLSASDACASLGLPSASEAETLAECLAHRSICTAADLERKRIALSSDLAPSNLGTLGDEIGSSCPTPVPTGAKSTSAARLAFGSISKFVQQVTRGGVLGVYVSTPPPSSTGGRTVTFVGGQPRISFGSITKVPFTYRLGARSRSAAAVAEAPSLILAVQGEDGELADYFEVPLDPNAPTDVDVHDELELTYQAGFPGCAFTLEFATSSAGEVSEYTRALRVVDSAVATPATAAPDTPTPTPTPIASSTKTVTPIKTATPGTPTATPTPDGPCQSAVGPGLVVATTWTAAASPYCVLGDIDVSLLTIEPGVTVLLSQDASISVLSTITAVGTEAEPIVFTARDQMKPWAGIKFVDAQQGSQLVHVVVEYAGEAGISIVNTSPVITNAVIQHNTSATDGAGVRALQDATHELVIEDSLIANNTVNPTASTSGDVGGGGVFIDGSARLTRTILRDNIVIARCRTGNQCAVAGRGAGVYGKGGSLTIEGSAIIANHVDAFALTSTLPAVLSAQGLGGGIHFAGTNLAVTNTLTSCNEVKADCSNPGFGSCGRTVNGAGIFVATGTAEVLNATVAHSTGAPIGGGNPRAISVAAGATLDVHNAIVYFNDAGEIGGSATVEYSDVDDGGVAGQGNVSLNPVFANQAGCESADLRIVLGSPAVDAGDPGAAFADACFPPSFGTTRNDMGSRGGPGACGLP